MYMLDANICIYGIKGNRSILSKISDNAAHLCISAVALGELVVGVEKSRQREKNALALEKFLRFIHVVPFGKNAAVKYGEIRGRLENIGEKIGNRDAMIAACALCSGSILVTHNIKEFSRIRELDIEDWYT